MTVTTEENNTAPETPEIQVQPAQKRGRGRPPKNPPSASGPAEESPTGNTAQGASTAKPRKPRGAKIDVGQLSMQLVGLHKLAVMATGNQFPELEISPQEAGILAQGISGVCEHYDLNIDGKTGAFLQLFGAAAMVYAPRVMAIRQRVNAARPVDTTAREVNPTMQ